ncbi:MAG: ribonuclease III [Acidobacteriota bacterium]|nr:ribonuclease III [Acidobacteriota bacterium]
MTPDVRLAPAEAGPESLERALGYTFKDRALLTRALTHSSSANESHPGEQPLDNERLEFLGDSVLGWLVSEWLFTHFPDFTEGRLSLLKNHLVSAAHLLAAAHQLDLGQFLHLGRGEETAGGRSKQRLLVNAFEAVLAAIYLDGGAGAVRAVLLQRVIPDVEELQRIAGSGPPHDYRAELERLARDRNLPHPTYQLLEESGPGHARTFRVEVRVGKGMAYTAEGSSKKAAAHNAAREICRQVRSCDGSASTGQP